MKENDDDHHQYPHKLPTPEKRIVYEYDFFDENRTGTKHVHELPLLKSPPKETMFPEKLLKSPLSQESDVPGLSTFADASADQRKRKIMRMDNDDDDDYYVDEAKRRAKLNGKQKINFFDQESEDDDHDHDHDHDEVSYSYSDEYSTSLATADSTVKSSSKSPNSNPNPNAHEQVPPPIRPQLDPRLVELSQEQSVLLFEKKLELSDIKHNQNRLLITRSDRLMGYLTEEERGKVEINEKEKSLEVMTDDPNYFIYKMHLKKWPKMRAIVLNREWFKLVVNNELQKGDTVQGWGYRSPDDGNQFRLGIRFIRKPEA